MQTLLYSGFHPTIYGNLPLFAIAKIFQKNPCPGNGSFAKIDGDSFFPFFVIG
jgi:hypothetical protein